MAKRAPGVRMISAMPRELLAQLRAIGANRCHVLVPDCRAAPVAEVTCNDGISRLLCRQHAIHFCRRDAIAVPAELTEGTTSN